MARSATIEIYWPLGEGDIVIVPFIRNPRGGGAVANGKMVRLSTASFAAEGGAIMERLFREYSTVPRVPSDLFEEISPLERRSILKNKTCFGVTRYEDGGRVVITGPNGGQILTVPSTNAASDIVDALLLSTIRTDDETGPVKAKKSPFVD